MQVIDFHVHIGNPRTWHPWVLDLMKKGNPDQFDDLEGLMHSGSLEDFLKGQGIWKAVVLADNCPLTTGVVSNDYVAEFCKGNDFFIPFASIHPDQDHLVKATVHCIKKLGFKGIKMYPTYQHFFPNDENMYPLYETAQELKVPIMFHTGSSVFKGSKIKFGEPKLLDEVAVDFPELRIVMAHSGRSIWYEQAILLATLHPNVYMEISGLPPKNLLRYFPTLEKVADKVIFGSDWPTIGNIKGNIEAVKGLGLSPEAIDGMLGGNAMRVLGLGR